MNIYVYIYIFLLCRMIAASSKVNTKEDIFHLQIANAFIKSLQKHRRRENYRA